MSVRSTEELRDPLPRFARRIVNGSRSAFAWGPHNYIRRFRWLHEMEQGAMQLPQVPIAREASTREVHYLTGPRHWFMTAFCHASLLDVAREPIMPVVHSDGRLDDASRAQLRRLFPHVRFPDPIEAERHLDVILPRERYPTLREQRGKLVFLRKLLDVHAGRSGPALVLDSDVLFLKRPDEVLTWLAAPAGYLALRDTATYYGYSQSLLEEVVGAPLPERVNAGLVAVPERAAIDWMEIECAMRTLVAREGLSYFLEQVIDAMIYRSGPLTYLDEHKYRVAPKSVETKGRRIIMGHYVAASRMHYLKQGWRQVLEKLRL